MSASQGLKIAKINPALGAALAELNENIIKLEQNQITLANRVDLIYEIYHQAENLLNKHSRDLIEADREQVQKIKLMALDFLKVIYNTEALDLIERYMYLRSKNRDFNPEYLPGMEPRKLTRLMSQFYSSKSKLLEDKAHQSAAKIRSRWRRIANLGLALKRGKIMAVNAQSRNSDLENQAQLLTPGESDSYRIIIQKSLFVQRQADNNFKAVSTIGYEAHYKKDFAAFTINTEGAIYIFNHYGGDPQKPLLVHS